MLFKFQYCLSSVLLALSIPAVAATTADTDDFDPAVIEEFAPVSLAKGNELFIGAYIDQAVSSKLKQASSASNSSSIPIVQVNVRGPGLSGLAGGLQINVCSLTLAQSRQGSPTTNICTVGAVVVHEGK